MSERRDRQTVFNKRINDAAHKLASPDADPNAQNAALERFALEAKAIFAEQISPAYEKSMTHAFEIMMLTDEIGLLEPLIRIQEALKAERASFKATMSLADKAARGETVTAEDHQQESQRREATQARLEKDIFTASSILTVTAMRLFSPLSGAVATFDIAAMLKRAEDDRGDRPQREEDTGA